MARDPLKLTEGQAKVLSLFRARGPCREWTMKTLLQAQGVPPNDRKFGKPPYSKLFGFLRRLEKRGFLLHSWGNAHGEHRWTLGPMADALEDAGRFPGREANVA